MRGAKVRLVAALLVGLATTAPAVWGEPAPRTGAQPVTLAVVDRFGGWVEQPTGANTCPSDGFGACEAALPGQQAGSYRYPRAVAVDRRTGDVYVADTVNNRVQELTAQGVFLEAFGWDVNRAKTRDHKARQTERNLCQGSEAHTSSGGCGAGAAGVAPEQFKGLSSIAVDPSSGELYTAEVAVGNYRVARYTPEGRFVWTVGGGVNASTHGDFCSAEEVNLRHVHCGAGHEAATGGHERLAFRLGPSDGDLLAVGGPRDLVYVGDEHRVVELSPDGRWVGEVAVGTSAGSRQGRVQAIAVDRRGELYVLDVVGSGRQAQSLVYEYDPHGKQTGVFALPARTDGNALEVNALAVDSYGRLLTVGVELESALLVGRFGEIFDAVSGRPLSAIAVSTDNDGIAVDSHERLYLVATDQQELTVYEPATTVVLVSSPVGCDTALDYGSFGLSCVVPSAVKEPNVNANPAN